MSVIIAALYHFAEVEDTAILQEYLQQLCHSYGILGM